MKTGIVAGQVWATKRLEELPAGALLEIAVEEQYTSEERLIAFDPYITTDRFVRLQVEVGSAPLAIHRFHYRETGYPHEIEADFLSSDESPSATNSFARGMEC